MKDQASSEDELTKEVEYNDKRLPTDEVFSILGNKTRIKILKTLWEAQTKEGHATSHAVSFEELRKKAGAKDSGNFNYHLNKLTDHYVRNTDDGYELTSAGSFLVGAIVAGTIDQRPKFGTFTFDGTCPECGEKLAATFDDVGTIHCPGCGRRYVSDAFPPAGTADRTPNEIAHAFDRWVRYRSRMAREGVCPRCAGALDSHTRRKDNDSGMLITEYVCRNCRHEESMPLVSRAFELPEVIAFYDDRGVDLSSLPYWELRPHIDKAETVVVSEDPLRVDVTLHLDGDTLTVRLDDLPPLTQEKEK